MMQRRGILTAGTWCADHNKVVTHWPGENGLAEILSETVRGGGSACNLALAIRRLDEAFPVETMGLVGDDSDGSLLVETTLSEGLGGAGLTVLPGVRTAYTDAFAIRASGRRVHLFHPGAAALLEPRHFSFDGTNARILHLGLPGLHARMDAPHPDGSNGWSSVLEAARRSGLETSLELVSVEAARLRSFVAPCLPLLDYLIVNDYEVSALSSSPARSPTEVDHDRILDAVQEVLARGSMRLVVAHFPTGAVYAMRDGSIGTVPSVAVPAEYIAGTNGAGDAFAAGALYGLHEEWPPATAIRLGHAAAAMSCLQVSTTDGLMDVESCLARADEFGWRSSI
jgi:sugar/nucleoside kinase (ribokinase family)